MVDVEWLQLITEAKRQGVSIEEIRQFLAEVGEKRCKSDSSTAQSLQSNVKKS